MSDRVDRVRAMMRVEQSTKIREDWIYAMAREAQLALGERVFGGNPRQAFVSLLRNAPLPATRLEELVYCGMLLESAIGGFGPSPETRAERIVRALGWAADGGRRSSVMRDTLAMSAAEWIEQHFAEPLHVERLARTLGCHQTTLRRTFAHRTGESMRAYQRRVRVAAAVRLFDEGVNDVLAVARLVGYGSEKNFYRAVRMVTGMTPAEIKRRPSGSIAPVDGSGRSGGTGDARTAHIRPVTES